MLRVLRRLLVAIALVGGASSAGASAWKSGAGKIGLRYKHRALRRNVDLSLAPRLTFVRKRQSIVRKEQPLADEPVVQPVTVRRGLQAPVQDL